MDPPFDCGLGEPALQLATNARLHKAALFILKAGDPRLNPVPEALYRCIEKTAGDVLYRLLNRAKREIAVCRLLKTCVGSGSTDRES